MTDLTRIANKCGTDKGTLNGEAHGFTEIYDRYFQDFKNLNRPLKILEIGVQFGGSILMLQEYFKYCDVEIYGLDIALSQCSVSFDSNVHLVEGDQNSKESHKAMPVHCKIHICIMPNKILLPNKTQ